MKKTVYPVCALLAFLISACSSVDLSVLEDQCTERMQISINEPLYVPFEIQMVSDKKLDADALNSIQSKLVKLKKYRFTAYYNVGGHYVLRDLEDLGQLTFRERKVTELPDSPYLLKIALRPNVTNPKTVSSNVIFSCVASYEFFKNSSCFSAGEAQARRGVLQRRSFSKVESGQSDHDATANLADMIQISFNRLLAGIYNAIPLSAAVSGGFGETYTIRYGNQQGFMEGGEVFLIEKVWKVCQEIDNQKVWIRVQQEEIPENAVLRCEPVAKGVLTGVKPDSATVEITEWFPGEKEEEIGEDINFVRKNPGKLFILTADVEKEFFNR